MPAFMIICWEGKVSRIPTDKKKKKKKVSWEAVIIHKMTKMVNDSDWPIEKRDL